MGDEWVVLLERVLAENNRLREAMEARDTENQRLLKKLCSKLDGENADPVMPRTKNNRKRTRNVVITQQCRVSIYIIPGYVKIHTVTSTMQASASLLSKWTTCDLSFVSLKSELKLSETAQ